MQRVWHTPTGSRGTNGSEAGGRGSAAARCLLAVGLSVLTPACALGPEASRDQAASARVHALLINGGGEPRINYQSHLDHLEGMLAVLQERGVAQARITVLSADGADPATDLAVRPEPSHPALRLLPESLGRQLERRVVQVDSRLPGAKLRPATREVLEAWFVRAARELTPGDTLLLYVTDHGRKNAQDLTDNWIQLWGERLSVRELDALLARLDTGVRVVLVMSQCYSGAFANTIYQPGETLELRGNVCGYFSVPADRRAYGCYADAFRDQDTGHSHRLIDALGVEPGLASVHRATLVTDQTPDVPLATSDLHLRHLLQRAAGDDDARFAQGVDALLGEVFAEPARWEAEIRLLDEIAHVYGLPSPRSFAELRERADELEALSEQLGTYEERWEKTLDARRTTVWSGFLAEHPDWRDATRPASLRAHAEASPDFTNDLLAALAAFVRRDAAQEQRLESLRERAEQARRLGYRNDVRLAALLRMETVLVRVAGLRFLESGATDAERQGLAALEACEDLVLGGPSGNAPASWADATPPLPTLEEDRVRLESVVPAWLGIAYAPVRVGVRRDLALPAGAVVVNQVYADSPADRAGIQPSDILVATAGRELAEPHALREWAMQGEVGEAHEVELLRDETRLRVSVALARFPVKLPSLPGPPALGSVAPPLGAELLDGGGRLVAGRERLVFFWASWCGFCHRALPELAALAEARGLEVVAITDEDPDHVRDFLRQRDTPFPGEVAIDRRRSDFQLFGVSGTPTFVWIDAEGVVRGYHRGYSPQDGIRLPGWRWQEGDQAWPTDRSSSTRSP